MFKRFSLRLARRFPPRFAMSLLCFAALGLSLQTAQAGNLRSQAQQPKACQSKIEPKPGLQFMSSPAVPQACYQTRAQPSSSRAVLCCPSV